MDKSKIYKNKKDEWYTPLEIIEYAESVIGKITLDPATTKENLERLKIPKGYTKWEDGLNQEWKDETIWLNPPFSNKDKWIEKARFAVDYRNCKVMILLPMSLETKIFREQILGQAIIHIPNKRISFIAEDGKTKSGSSFTSGLFELTKNYSNEYKLFNLK